MDKKLKELFEKLWNQYTERNPVVKKVYDLLKSKGEEIVNDHIAFRTFNHPKTNIDVLSQVFKKHGYRAKQEYQFEEKKLRAVHFENADDVNAPLIFISELKTEEFSDFLNEIVEKTVGEIPAETLNSDDLVYSGRLWNPISYNTYEKLRKESEYAAWLYVEGFKANHFTVLVNELNEFDELKDLNEFLKDNGFIMNSPPNEIQGSKEKFLEQSSIKASLIKEKFIEGEREVTGCYYEFAKRYHKPDGKLFRGFIANSADKIFESTDFYKAGK